METHPNQQHGSEAGGFYFALFSSMEECVGLPPVCEWAVKCIALWEGSVLAGVWSRIQAPLNTWPAFPGKLFSELIH